ncbi:FtsX-like permease family protein [Nonomuraea candida]|uniref:FtsX-like permease family protein n=1 Tax=Nonomuraea candida TaxID=359159 RepID=UPI0005BBFDD3|nr:FtsX-like permease family protein [Nonomuraea candida]
MSALRAALRLSRRDALRAKGRSALIMVMIGLPVLVITALLTLSQTSHLTAREELPSRLGAVADAAVLSHLRRTPIEQDPAGRYGNQRQEGARPSRWTTAEVAALTGGRLLPFHAYPGEARLGAGFDPVDVLEIDLRDPLATGLRSRVEGRLPAAPQEIAVTPALLDAGVRVGDTLQVTRHGAPKRVVGVVEHPSRPGIREVVALYDALRPDEGTWRGAGWLVDTPAPVTWEDVRRLNQAGLRVASRAVIESPRAAEWDRRPLDAERPRWLAIGVILVVTETALLAGPAFAVGLRRRARELATIAAQGGSPGQLRTLVLADGLLLGGAAALIGAALGVGTGLAAARVVATALDWRAGPPDVPWSQVLGVAALGLVSALVAALAPAVRAARQSPALVLAGRTAEVRGRARVPVPGIVLVLLGAGLMVPMSSGNALGAVAASTVLLFGLIALTPWIVRRTGRWAGHLPLPMRLSIRDGARHPGRTASAVAAVMAATMCAITIGIAAGTALTARQSEFRLDAPEGTLIVRASGVGEQDWAEVRAAFRQRLPGADLVAGLEAVDGAGRSLSTSAVRPAEAACSGCLDASYDEAAIGDARLLALFQGRRDPRAAAALAAGRAVVFDPRLISDGTVTVALGPARDPYGDDRRIRVPAVAATGAQPHQGGVVLPPSALTAAGYKTAERRLYTVLDAPDLGLIQRAMQAVTVGGLRVNVENDTTEEELAFTLWASLAGALVLVLGGTFAATGLAVADMRRDLDTLSAVGGRPLTRRLVVAAQAGHVAGLGAVMGLVAGLGSGTVLAGATMRDWHGGAGIVVPLPLVAALVIGLPLLAALLAGLFTRTRMEPARRLA